MTLLQPRRRESRAGVRVTPGLLYGAWDYGLGQLGGLLRHPRFGLAGGVADRRVAHLDTEEARRHSAVFACRDLIARIPSTLPIHEYRRDSATGRLVRVPDPAPWLEQANPGRLFVDASYALLDSALARGMAFARVSNLDRFGWPRHIEDIDPREMRVWYASPEDVGARDPDRVRVQWYRNDEPVELWPRGDIWAMHGYPMPGWPISVSPITYAALSILTGLEADEFGHEFFRDASHPTGVLMFPEAMERETRQHLLDDWEEGLLGNRRTRALSHGGMYKPISIAPEESQFLNTVAASVADVSRFFGVDPRDIGANVTGQGSLTYSNPWSDNLRLLTRTHRPWIYRLEQALTTLRPRGRVIKIGTDEMLRVDALTQARIFDLRIVDGIWSVNDARTALDMEPVEGGDRRVWPPKRTQLDEPELAGGADAEPDDPSSIEPAVVDPDGDPTDGQIGEGDGGDDDDGADTANDE